MTTGLNEFNNKCSTDFIVKNDWENFEAARWVALGVGAFHIPLFGLDVVRFFTERTLYLKPGFTEIAVIHAFYFSFLQADKNLKALPMESYAADMQEITGDFFFYQQCLMPCLLLRRVI